MLETLHIRQFKDGEVREVQDAVVLERVVRVVINGSETLRHSMSPELYREFATGFMLTSGMADSRDDIFAVVVENDDIHVSLKNFRPVDAMIKGASGGFMAREAMRNPGFPTPPALDLTALIPLFDTFSRKSIVFKQTGGTHSAALSDARKLLYFAEDIGRHNAVDKAVGLGVLGGADLSRMVLLTSGRISSEIVQKALHARIPAIISHSAPTSLAIRRAAECGMTLIGFLRGNRFNIYT